MHLAINYSPSAAKLVIAGKITIDYFKTADWEWMVDEAKSLRPVAVHFTLEAGNAALGAVNWEDASIWLKRLRHRILICIWIPGANTFRIFQWIPLILQTWNRYYPS
jgi:hypothetical protein